jgi:hypothetical protein
MRYERVPTPANIWEYASEDDGTQDELLQVTYENGNRVWIVRQGDYWVVDQSLMPDDLRSILRKYDGKEFRLVRVGVNSSMSGYVGHPLVFRIVNDDLFYGRDALCTSMTNVRLIEVIVRRHVSHDGVPTRSSTHFDTCG